MPSDSKTTKMNHTGRLCVQDLCDICLGLGVDLASVYLSSIDYYEGTEYRFVDISSNQIVMSYRTETRHIKVSKGTTECLVPIEPIFGFSGVERSLS